MKQGQLLRVVGRNEVLALSFGAMIGWSWVALTGNWITQAGSLGAILAFLAGGIVVIFVGLTYAELSSAIPLVGGEHAYSLRALGPIASFICTWSILLGYVSVVAFEAVALPTVLDYLLPNLSHGYLWTVAGWDVHFTWVLVGILGAIFITLINFFGIQMASRLQMFATLIVIIGGLALIGGATFSGEVENFSPLFNNGPKGFLSVIIMVPFMFVGFDVIPQSAEEINLPFAQIGKAIMLSIITAILWYMLIIWSVSMGLESQQRELSLLPTAEASSALFKTSTAGKIIVIAGIGGLLTSWNAFLIGGSRALYALAQAGQLPAIFGELHPRYNTPYKAILLIGSLSIIAPLFGRPALVWLVDAGGLGIILAYIFVAISFLVLRVREPNMKRPFKVRNWRIVGGLALLLSCGILLLYLPGSPASLIWPYEWMIIFIWVLLGIFLFKRKRDDL